MSQKTLAGGFAFFFLLLMASPLAKDRPLDSAQLVIWNVGQGLWVTRLDPKSCHHFDFGGEGYFTRIGAFVMCKSLANNLWLSHFDRDHHSYAREIARRLPNLSGDQGLNRRLKFLPPLQAATIKHHESIYSPRQTSESDNENSQINLIDGLILHPGDSPSTEELNWAPRLPRGIKILIVGHHGSRSSTSNYLLGRLPDLKMAIVSARKRRYGHPHFEVIERLREHGVAVLRTEDWGSISIQYKPN